MMMMIMMLMMIIMMATVDGHIWSIHADMDDANDCSGGGGDYDYDDGITDNTSFQPQRRSSRTCLPWSSQVTDLSYI